jgi:hypothetical protein
VRIEKILKPDRRLVVKEVDIEGLGYGHILSWEAFKRAVDGEVLEVIEWRTGVKQELFTPAFVLAKYEPTVDCKELMGVEKCRKVTVTVYGLREVIGDDGSGIGVNELAKAVFEIYVERKVERKG